MLSPIKFEDEGNAAAFPDPTNLLAQYGLDRAGFIKHCPQYVDDWLLPTERDMGLLQSYGHLGLADEREVIVARFEQGWYVSFYNGHPPDHIKERRADARPTQTSFTLSHEAMCTWIGLYALLREEPNDDRHWLKAQESMARRAAQDAERSQTRTAGSSEAETAGQPTAQ